MPQKVIDVIGKHFQSSGNEFPESEESSMAIVSSSSSETPGFYLREIPLEHQVDTVGWKWIFPILGDGACLDNAAAAHIYGDPNQAQHLKRLRHYFKVENWWYFQPFYIPYHTRKL